MDEFDVVIRPEDFLEHFELGDSRLPLSRRQRAALFSLAIDFAKLRGSARYVPAPPPPPDTYELRVAQTAFHVRLDLPSRQELETFLKLAGLLMLGTGEPLTLTAAAAAALRDRIAKTKVEYGERSVVDAVIELGNPTVDQVVELLRSNPCRHPGAGCRFEREGHCSLATEQAHEIAEALSERKILRPLNAYEPREYGVVF